MSGSLSGDNRAAPSSVLLYSHSWLPRQVDGVAIRMMSLAEELAQRGVKVTVVTPDFVLDKSKTPQPFVAIPKVEHETLESQLTPVYRKNMCMAFSMGNLSKLIGIIRRVQPDVVHATTEASLQLMVAACLYCDVPLVVSMHTDVAQIAEADKNFSSFLGGWLGRLHAKSAVFFAYLGYRFWAASGAVFFPVSKQARGILKDANVLQSRLVPLLWGPMVDRKVFRIDLPEDQVKAKRKDLTFGIPNAYLMVYVGRVTEEKDVEFLVDALDRAPANVVLALVGAGKLADKLREKHGKEHRIHCSAQMVSRAECALSLRAADCCVSASTMETIGFTAMESLSCGTPFLAARAQGFAEHLSHEENARLWTPYDEKSFDQELKALMSTKLEGKWSKEALRESMAENSSTASTDRAIQAYAHASRGRSLRAVTLTVGAFLFNWSLTPFVK
eukprot:TRINITY_DN8678_c0_g1_i1.p1 TRINITY_DN8678_c0_g1~~TRINITY_DN8678_c0_g1_i1.p1  ORF type:complete len:445 (-),score=102.88 TRINITY_DN8678_c0_g1_i1:64-1398(-)